MLPIHKMESWEIQTICTQILHLRERGRCANWTEHAEAHCHCFRFHLTKHSHFSQLRTLYTKAYLALCMILFPSKNYWNPRPFQGQSSVLEPSSLWRSPLKFFLIKSTGAADVDMLWMIPWWWWVTQVQPSWTQYCSQFSHFLVSSICGAYHSCWHIFACPL
jgi:hypothetical protein